MREIKFRGIDFDNEWAYGYLWCTHSDIRVSAHISTLDGDILDIYPETVGQYTGRKLCSATTNKKEELFDGDVIGWFDDYDDKWGYAAIAYGHGIIVWNEENCCFGVKTSENNIQDFNDFDFDDSCVIIGNIYDNPELMDVR